MQTTSNSLNLKAGITDLLGGSARTKETKTKLLETLGKGKETSLVVD